jgi:hypothetical protein
MIIVGLYIAYNIRLAESQVYTVKAHLEAPQRMKDMNAQMLREAEVTALCSNRDIAVLGQTKGFGG